MGDYFCGWYFKCQNNTQTIAIIPAYHITKGVKSCSIQVIMEDGSWNVQLPSGEFQRNQSGIHIGENHFGKAGIVMNLHSPKLTAVGSLSFGQLAPLRYDIMGPFKYVPFMECRHSVFSMRHSVSGMLVINGTVYEFREGVGYIEGDRGRSFPKEYLWAQCCFHQGSLMLSVADIPFCGLHFTGVIGAIHYQGKEYRLGTYLGARAVCIRDGEVIIKQGCKQLTAKQLEKKNRPLAAPLNGSMSRTIHEAPACRAYFHYQEGRQTVFEFEVTNGAFEYEYGR